VYWQFVGAIKGMGTACRKFETPVTGGNVSFYNQTVNEDGTSKPVFPTPTIGMLGIMEDKSHHMTMDFKYKGDLIYLIGESQDDLNSSEYLYNVLGIKNTPAPHFDLEQEFNIQQHIKHVIQNNLITAAHDISDGGLWVTLAEMGMASNLGFDIETPLEYRKDAFLFGEAQSRVVVTVPEVDKDAFLDYVLEHKVPAMLLGHVTKGRFTIDGEEFGSVDELAEIYNNAIGNFMKKK
jgi:phosphoribosylformylglycinamidine synthase